MKSKDLRNIKKILAKTNVQQAYLFGSHARGIDGPLSDIDIAVLYAAGKNNDRIESKLFAELSQALKTDNIDIIDIRRASPLLAHRAVLHGKALLQHDRHAEAVLKTAILHAYEDTRHLRAIKQRVFI